MARSVRLANPDVGQAAMPACPQSHLDQRPQQPQLPAYIQSESGPEFVAVALREWLAGVDAKTAHIEPGSPWENSHCEGFKGRLRGELLNGVLLYTINEARTVIEAWRRHYNTVRPHTALG